MITKFYEKALPQRGELYCIAWIPTTLKGMRHEWVESIDEVEPTIKALQKQHGENLNIFVALSTFKSEVREARNSSHRKCIFIDLDVGEDKAESGKGYATKEDAMVALKSFVDEAELPDPVFVDSGNGIHAYYIFDEDITIEEWKPYADKFLALCQSKGLIVDSSVMCDAARIMRSPNTINCKKDKAPVATALLSDEVVTYPLETIKSFLSDVAMPLQAILQQAAKIPMTEEEKKAAKLGNFEASFDRLAKKSINGNGCGQIKHILETHPDQVSYDQWFSILSIAQHCSDRNEAIHEISKHAKNYNYQDTEFKANETQNKPHTCEQFNKHTPGICEGCPHRGKIKPANPLALTSEFVPAPSVNIVPAQTSKSLTTNKEFIGLPKDLRPFIYGGNEGGIYYQPPQEVDEDGNVHTTKPVLVCKHDLYPIKRIYSEDDGEFLELKALLPSKIGETNERIFRMNFSDIYDVNKFKEIITKRGITYDPSTNQGKYLMQYIYKWADYLVNNSDPDIMRKQFGWSNKGDAFTIGNTEFKNINGQVFEAESALGGNAKYLSKFVNKVGSYDKWKVAANMLNTEGFELHAFVLLTSFGSPLLRETSTSGMTISLFNKDSGTAKTGAMYAALSAWGEPKDLSLSGIRRKKDNVNTTHMGIVNRYLGLKNIPFGFDEMGAQDSEDVSALIHSISNGKAKVRLKSSANEEREYEMDSSMIALFTSNHSIHSKLIAINRNPNGELARFLEFKIERPSLLTEDSLKGTEIFQAFRQNYGWAGPEFIKHIMSIPKEVILERIKVWNDRAIKDYSSDGVYRFYHNTLAVTFTAAEILNELNIINFDIERIYKVVVSKMLNIKNSVMDINTVDYEGILGEYLNANHLGTLTIENKTALADVRAAKLVIRADIDNSTMSIESASFQAFLTPLGINVNDFVDQMNLLGYKVYKHKRRMGAGWKPASGISAVSTIEFDTTKFLEDIIKEQKESQDAA
jgi:hypothetical protein